MTKIKFFVPGKPVPKGSARAFVVKGRAIVTQSNSERQKPWASLISYSAGEAMQGKTFSGPVCVAMHFTMPRPKKHYRSNGELKPDAPDYHATKPDIDKLARLVLDALTNYCYADDSMVYRIFATKQFGEHPGVTITVREGG